MLYIIIPGGLVDVALGLAEESVLLLVPLLPLWCECLCESVLDWNGTPDSAVVISLTIRGAISSLSWRLILIRNGKTPKFKNNNHIYICISL